MIKVLTEFTKQAAALIKKVGIKDARKQKPAWFTDTGPRTTTKLDPRTGKAVSGQKASKASKRITTSPSSKTGFTEAQLAKYRAAYRDPKAWAKVPPAIKKKLLA